jgi:hypothetical protein
MLTSGFEEMSAEDGCLD